MSTLTTRRIRRFGWRPDTPDQRDRSYAVVAPKRLSSLPLTHQLVTSRWMPPVYDQGQLGSCTANAIAGAFEYDLRRQGLGDFRPSRLAIYYGERVIEGTVRQDAGAEIRDGMKVIGTQGAATEALWPYNVAKFAQVPPSAYYAEAKKHAAVSYESIPQTEVDLKRALYSGYPIVFGISVYESFESDAAAATGTIPMPKASEQMIGGHAILMCGYGTSRVSFRNSWGDGWGKAGNGTLPLAYVLNPNLASDFWLVKALQG